MQRLLDLNDAELDDVIGAVEIWCRLHDLSIDSPTAADALDVAAARRRTNDLSKEQLVDILTRAVQI